MLLYEDISHSITWSVYLNLFWLLHTTSQSRFIRISSLFTLPLGIARTRRRYSFYSGSSCKVWLWQYITARHLQQWQYHNGRVSSFSRTSQTWAVWYGTCLDLRIIVWIPNFYCQECFANNTKFHLMENILQLLTSTYSKSLLMVSNIHKR